MEMKDILELERKNNEQILEQKLKQAHYEAEQQTLNTGINIISMQMRLNTFAFMCSALRDS